MKFSELAKKVMCICLELKDTYMVDCKTERQWFYYSQHYIFSVKGFPNGQYFADDNILVQRIENIVYAGINLISNWILFGHHVLKICPWSP